MSREDPVEAVGDAPGADGDAAEAPPEDDEDEGADGVHVIVDPPTP